MRFSKDSRYRAGGFWRCAVKHSEIKNRGYHRRMEDPVFRIERRLQQARARRAIALAKRGGERNPRMAAFLAVTRRSTNG